MPRENRRNIPRIDYNVVHMEAIQIAQREGRHLQRIRMPRRRAPDRDEAEEPPRRRNRADPLLEVFFRNFLAKIEKMLGTQISNIDLSFEIFRFCSPRNY